MMVAKKKYDDHGGVLTVQQSLYHAAHDYGLPALCGLYGWSVGDMRNRLALTQPRTHPTLENGIAILEATRDPRILTAVCEPVGAVWNWADEVKDAPGDLDVLATGVAFMSSSTNVVKELQQALEDGQIDAVEKARIRQCGFEMIQQLQRVLQTAERFEVGG